MKTSNPDLKGTGKSREVLDVLCGNRMLPLSDGGSLG